MAVSKSPNLAAERKRQAEKYNQYRNGGEGFILWAEENLYVPVFPIGSEFSIWVPLKDLPRERHPETGRSYWDYWCNQKEVFREALRMENGKFVHSLIVFIWQRGEGKSFMANLIQLWKFCCWPKQNIVLCSNSKDQSSFLQFEEIKSIIENSPNLVRLIGKKNIQAAEIRRRDSKGNIVSRVQSVSSFSGIFSNITGYAFSEFFECKREDFFAKVDGSLRNVPNAFGVIDSTVSSKAHTLYLLYKAYQNKEDPRLFVSYRCSQTGDYRDYWHPYNTQAQLNSYRVKSKLGEFARFFLNLWSAGSERVFSQEQVEACSYIGANKSANCHKSVIELLRRKIEIVDSDKRLVESGVDVFSQDQEIRNIEKRLWPVSDIYALENGHGFSQMAPAHCLEKLSDIYDTNWAIIGGMDRADPLKRRTSARSIFLLMAKGLPGSRSNPYIGVTDKNDDDEYRHLKNKVKVELKMPELKYLYFLLYLVDIVDHSLEAFKTHILAAHEEYGGINVIGSERYGAWDLAEWGNDLDIKFDLFHPNYGIQLAAFTYAYTLIDTGRFKTPACQVAGSKMEDIFCEELTYFDHDSDKKWFGSPEKAAKNGVQDDVMFSLGNGLYSGRFIGVDDFQERSGEHYWGTIQQPKGLKGVWGI